MRLAAASCFIMQHDSASCCIGWRRAPRQLPKCAGYPRSQTLATCTLSQPLSEHDISAQRVPEQADVTSHQDRSNQTAHHVQKDWLTCDMFRGAGYTPEDALKLFAAPGAP